LKKLALSATLCIGLTAKFPACDEVDSLTQFDPAQKIIDIANGISTKRDSLSGILEAPLQKVNNEVQEKS
jgi:hypothetical protein